MPWWIKASAKCINVNLKCKSHIQTSSDFGKSYTNLDTFENMFVSKLSVHISIVKFEMQENAKIIL